MNPAVKPLQVRPDLNTKPAFLERNNAMSPASSPQPNLSRRGFVQALGGASALATLGGGSAMANLFAGPTPTSAAETARDRDRDRE